MQNFTPFWIFVTSRFINGLFRKNSHPLLDTNVDHYSDIQWDYWLGNQTFFFEYILDDRHPLPKVLFADKNTERNGKALEWRKLRHCRAGTIFLFATSRYHHNLLSNVHQSLQKHQTELVNKTGPRLSNVISPFGTRMGLKVRQDEKMVTILIAFWGFFCYFYTFKWS